MSASEVMQVCREKGISVIQRGQAWHLLGNGIDVIVASLNDIGTNDLLPAYVSHSKITRIASTPKSSAVNKWQPSGKVSDAKRIQKS